MTAKVKKDGAEVTIEGSGNGPIDAYVDALKQDSGKDIKVFSYSEHSVDGGSDATAIAFVETEVDGKHHMALARSTSSRRPDRGHLAVNRPSGMAVSMKLSHQPSPVSGRGRPATWAGEGALDAIVLRVHRPISVGVANDLRRILLFGLFIRRRALAARATRGPGGHLTARDWNRARIQFFMTLACLFLLIFIWIMQRYFPSN